MTTSTPSAPAPFPVPDYAGGSLLNLTSSLVRALGGRSPYPECRFLRAAALRPFRRIVLLLVDGLGESQLADYLSTPAGRRSPFFAAHPRRVIDTVAPATTASVVTTLSTGASPAAHAVLGWHLHFPDLGLDGTPLPFTTRVGGPLLPPDFPLADYLAIPAPLATTRARRWLLSTRGIPGSPLSRAQTWWHERLDYLTLTGLVRALRTFAAAPSRQRAFAYAYWPRYDSLCHAAGPLSRRARAHLASIDSALARAAAALAPSGTLLLVTADHGLVPVRRTIRLHRLPGFLSTLATLPSGDARCTHFFVRPSRVPDFLAAFRKPPLAGAGTLVTGAGYIASGMLGPRNRRAHPALPDRVGDWVFLAAPGVILATSTPFDPSTFRPKGHHSGLSPEETRVPLFVVPPP